jgi:hypothetical protein
MIRPTSLARLVVIFMGLIALAVLIVACGEDDLDDEGSGSQNQEDPNGLPDLDTVRSVDELAELINSENRDDLRNHEFEIDAWISPPPTISGAPGTPPQGCPVVPEKQDWLTDDPIDTQIEVAGAAIPNEQLGEDLSILRLVVPYTLGFVDLPERATLRGTVLDEQHAECPGADTLFILSEVVDSLPAERDDNDDDLITDWTQTTSELGQLVLEYPSDWDLEEQDTGISARLRFLGPEPFRTIRLEIQEGETYWHPDADGSGAPDVLGGDRQELAIAGQADARLIDDRRRTSSGEREIRLVFNHDGKTIFLAMVIKDGANLDAESIWVFDEMARRMRLQGDVAMSDPMDPILAARDDIGEGPFLSEADARYVAINASGMTGAEAVQAELVSERDARTAVEGACRNFDGRPSGIWLVTVAGVTPSGREAHRLVYLDASNGNRLCQTEAPGVS